jgi:hypothetical protein
MFSMLNMRVMRPGSCVQNSWLCVPQSDCHKFLGKANSINKFVVFVSWINFQFVFGLLLCHSGWITLLSLAFWHVTARYSLDFTYVLEINLFILDWTQAKHQSFVKSIKGLVKSLWSHLVMHFTRQSNSIIVVYFNSEINIQQQWPIVDSTVVFLTTEIPRSSRS